MGPGGRKPSRSFLRVRDPRSSTVPARGLPEPLTPGPAPPKGEAVSTSRNWFLGVTGTLAVAHPLVPAEVRSVT